MLTIYSKNVTFQKNDDEMYFGSLGYGVLKDLYNDPLITEELNGSYILEFSYKIDGYLSEYLVEENIIKAKEQPFVIYDVKKDTSKISVLAKHWVLNEWSKDFLLDVAPTNLLSQDALSWIQQKGHNQTNIIINGDCDKVTSARYVRKNMIDAIYNEDNAILKRFGGELSFDKNNVFVHKKRGNKSGFIIRERKNLSGIEFHLDFSTVATKLLPLGKDGLLLNEIYVESPLINKYSTPIIKKVDLDTENQEELYEYCQSLFNDGIDKPNISIKIDFIELSKTMEYKKYSNMETVYLGDTVSAYIPSLDLSVETRVVKVVYNCNLKRITSLELGSCVPNISLSNAKIENSISKIIDNQLSFLAQARKDASDLIKHPFGGYIFFSENEGCIYIADNKDLNSAINVWKWGLGGLGFSSTGVNGTYETAITQDGSIVADFITTGKINTNVIEGYSQIVTTVQSQDNKISQVTQTVDELNSKISDVADITISGEDTDAQVELNNINESEPIRIVIRPTGNNISYDYPHEDYPQEDFSKIRTIRFINTKTEEVFDYILPTDLLYYDNEHYDEFILDYGGQTCVINKKVGYNADGTTYLLDEQTTLEFEYPRILLTDGDYIISVLGYENAYLFVRLMAKNIYTTQFATRAELNSEITQTKNSITSEVTGKIDTLNKEVNAKLEMKVNTDNLISEINASAGVINLKSNRLIIDSDNFKLTADGKITSTSGEIGGYSIDKTNLSANVGKKLLFPLETDEQYQQAYNKIYNHVYKIEILVGDELKKYDINKDGIIDKVDLLLLKRIYYGYEIIDGNFSINAGEYENTLSFKDPNGNVMTGIDLDSITTQYLSAKSIFSCPGSATIDNLEITGTFTNNSDERLKKDIKELSNEYINIVKNTRPVEFTYKNNNTRHIGFIAQELEKSFKESKIEEIPIKKDELCIYSIDYISLIGILWKTNQDLYKKIENLEIKLKGDDSK